MNDLWFFLPITILIIFLIPTLLEIFRRKDKGPREVLEMTAYEEDAEIESVRMLDSSEDLKHVRNKKERNIPDGTELQKDLVVKGNLTIGKNCRVHSTLKALGNVEIGESSIIDGSVLSRGEIVVRRNCKIGGVIVSIQNVTLEENVVVEAVSTEKTVKLGSGVQINQKIAGKTIVSS